MEPKRLPLIPTIVTRDATLDRSARLINGFTERTARDEQWVFKRPGLTTYQASAGAATGRGVYNWRGNIYSIFGSTIYKDGVSHGTGLNTSGAYTFSASLGGTPRLFFKNGAAAYTTDGTTVTAVSDADYPAATVPGSAYLDGTTYVMTSAAAIRGSDINDPTAWDPLNTITAQVEPDGGVALAKQLVYVVALKDWTTELFYDKANASGSPLAPVQGAKQPWGCRAAGSVQSIDDMLFWVGQTRAGSVNVVKMEGLKIQVVSTPAIERVLASANYTTTYSWNMHIQGHRFYGLTVTAANLTLVYDIKEGQWYIWTDTAGNYWPIVSSTFGTSQQVIVQHASNGALYKMDVAAYDDFGTLFTWELYTPNWDGEVKVKKFCSRLVLVGDQQPGNIVAVRTNDDDFDPLKWSHSRHINMGSAYPALDGLGTFRRRVHHFSQTAPYPVRLEAVELTLDLGTL